MNALLNDRVKVTRQANAAAAGLTAINGATLPLAGFDGVRGVAGLGALTATQVTSLKFQAGNAANGSDMADVAGAVTANAADVDSNKLLILDVAKSQYAGFAYGRFVVNRGTANAVVDFVIAEQYKARSEPVSQADATVSQVKSAY